MDGLTELRLQRPR